MCSLYVAFLRSLYALLTSALYMLSSRMICQCVFFVVLFVCAFYMCFFMRSLHELFLCALHVRSLIVDAQAVFITDKYRS